MIKFATKDSFQYAIKVNTARIFHDIGTSRVYMFSCFDAAVIKLVNISARMYMYLPLCVF